MGVVFLDEKTVTIGNPEGGMNELWFQDSGCNTHRQPSPRKGEDICNMLPLGKVGSRLLNNEGMLLLNIFISAFLYVDLTLTSTIQKQHFLSLEKSLEKAATRAREMMWSWVVVVVGNFPKAGYKFITLLTFYTCLLHFWTPQTHLVTFKVVITTLCCSNQSEPRIDTTDQQGH